MGVLYWYVVLGFIVIKPSNFHAYESNCRRCLVSLNSGQLFLVLLCIYLSIIDFRLLGMTSESVLRNLTIGEACILILTILVIYFRVYYVVYGNIINI